MARYLYRFGYETPKERIGNDRHGWDDESSSAFWVIAETPEEALAWGREVSEAMVRDLYIRDRWKGEPPSWKEDGYANWIEEDVDQFDALSLTKLPVVTAGEMPADLGWLSS